VPSGADIASRTPPQDDLPVLSTLSVQQKQKPSPDGRTWVGERLREIAALTKIGVPVTVVFDLDNTVFDTRHRTLHALQQFDVVNGTEHFKDATVSDMQVDGRLTATALGLQNDLIEAASTFWEISFWTPENLKYDVPIGDMVELVRRARDAGATVKFLTGRVASFHEDTLLQLKKAGIDTAGGDVVCKPDMHTRTAPFKELHLKAWSQASELGFFVTEGTRDLEHVQGFLPDVPLLRLDCSFEDATRVRRLPLWPGAF
jgi:hypothetical protein